MNKQIEALLVKARQEQQLFGTDPFEKFAELIVKECMGCCDIIAKVEWIETPTYELGVAACKLKIQQHFGVKDE